jgi:DNA-binding SARP family transcriptional activator
VGKTLEIRLLGELEVLHAGRRLPLPASKKTRAFVGYLVATSVPHLRERLCDLLWQGPDDPRAALRWSLTKMRGVLDAGGVKRVVADRERIAFEAKHAECDLHWVRAAITTGIANATTEALAQAAARFRGELLEGLDLPDAYRYHEWCVAEREAARALRTTLLAALVERHASAPETALGYARQRVAIDPLSEAAHAEVVRLLTELGKKREAEQQYEACKRILANELGAKPSPTLLAARLRQPPAPAPDPDPIPARAPVKRAPHAGSIPPAPPAILGRDDALGAINALVAAAARGSADKVLLALGEPGIGKTRLLEEVAAKTVAAGGRVLRGRAFEAEMVRPYGAWIDALRSAPLGEAAASLRADLAPILPELAAGAAAGGSGGAPTDKNLLFDAVARLLVGFAEHAPLAVILDDIQWFDEASAALLHFAARALSPSRVILACGARPEELSDNAAAVRLTRAMQRDGRLSEIELSALDGEAIAELARSVDARVDVERVTRESAGNPLFALEIARAMRAANGDAARPLAESLSGLIADRLERLDEAARDVVAWAAAIGRGFPVDLLQDATELAPQDLVGALEELERRGVLRATASTSGVDYDFVHDLIRVGAYRQLSAPRRRWMHQRIARTLHALSANDPALAGDVAHHAALAGDSELAARASLAAALRCLRIFANDEAARLAESALPHLTKLPRETRLRLHLELLRVKVFSGRWLQRREELTSEMSRAVIEAQDAGLHADAANGFHTISVLQHDGGDLHGAHESTLRAADAGRAADPLTNARQLSTSARCLAMIEREMDRARAMLDEAAAILGPSGAGAADLSFAWGHALLALYTGKTDEGAAHLVRALAAARRDEDRWAECDCLIRMTQLAIETGRPADALARCRELAPVAAKMGEGSERPVADALEALARVSACIPGADDHLARATAKLREIDAKGMLSYVLVSAAELDLAAKRRDAARARAEEGLRAAELVDRRSQIALARAILARVALADGDADAATRHLEAASADLERPLGVSARARAALAQAAALASEVTGSRVASGGESPCRE